MRIRTPSGVSTSAQREADAEVDRALGTKSAPPPFAGFGPPERGVRKLSAMTPTQARARVNAAAADVEVDRALGRGRPLSADEEVDRALSCGVRVLKPRTPGRTGFGPPKDGARSMPSITPTQARAARGAAAG